LREGNRALLDGPRRSLGEDANHRVVTEAADVGFRLTNDRPACEDFLGRQYSSVTI
jgi:hypothetical protein